jgi:hypothetical protein
MFAQSEEAPICSLDASLYFQTHVIRWCYRYSLTTSKCLSPITTLCPTSRNVLSFRAAILYSVFFHLFLTLLWLLLLPMLSKHPEWLTDSYRRYLYHRHMRVVVFFCSRQTNCMTRMISRDYHIRYHSAYYIVYHRFLPKTYTKHFSIKGCCFQCNFPYLIVGIRAWFAGL